MTNRKQLKQKCIQTVLMKKHNLTGVQNKEKRAIYECVCSKTVLFFERGGGGHSEGAGCHKFLYFLSMENNKTL